MPFRPQLNLNVFLCKTATYFQKSRDFIYLAVKNQFQISYVLDRQEETLRTTETLKEKFLPKIPFLFGNGQWVGMSIEASCIANEVILALATFFQHQRENSIFGGAIHTYVLNTAIHHFLEIGLPYLPTLKETYFTQLQLYYINIIISSLNDGH